MRKHFAARQTFCDEGADTRQHGIQRLRGLAVEGIGEKQQFRILVGSAAEHDAINVLQMRLALREVADAAVNDDGQRREAPLDLINQRIIKRRHVAVGLRA